MQIFRRFWGKGTIQGMPNCCIACKKAYQQERLVATNDHNKQLIFKFFVCRHSPKTFCSIFEFTTDTGNYLIDFLHFERIMY